MPSPPPSLFAAAKHLARALIAAAPPPRIWTPILEHTLRHHLLPSSSSHLTPSLIAAVIDPHLLPHHRLAAGLFHWASHQPNFSHTPLSYHSLLKSLSRHPRPLLSLLALARARRVSLSPASYRLAASSLLLSNRTLDAAELVDRAAVHLPPALHNSLLAAASSDASADLARQLFDKMLSRNIPLNDVGFGVFIGRHCRTVELDETLKLVEETKRRNCGINGSVVAVLIVDGLCRMGLIEDAWRALEELRARDCKPDFIAYRIVSEAFRLVGRVEDAGRILKQKRKLGVAPRAKDYGEFILSLISERRVREAKELAEAVVGGDFPIEDDVLNALIGSVSAVDPDAAVSFCKYMLGKERFPSLTMVSSMSRSLCKSGKGDEMCDIFRVLLDKGFFREVEQYNVMVSFLCKVGRLREAYDVLKEMRRNGFRPDISSYNILMEACCREDFLRPAKKLWDEMFANGFCPNLQTYNTLIKKFSKEGEVEEAHKLFCHMLEKGVVPDNVTYMSLIEVMCQEKRLEDALKILKKSMEHDAVASGLILSQLIFLLCKDGNFVAACGVMHDLPSTVENSDSHVILLKSLTNAGEVEMAMKHIEWVNNNSASKLPTILKELIAAVSTAPTLEPVLQLFRAVHARRLLADTVPWMNLLEGGLLSTESCTKDIFPIEDAFNQ